MLLCLCPPLLLVPLSIFFNMGRLVRSVLPLGHGRIMHLVVVYGFQGAADDAEKLCLTE